MAIYALPAGDYLKVREVGILEGALYTTNKVKIKKLFKKYGLKFNQGACLSNNLFLWQREGLQVEGKFTKDDEGVTTRAELVITGDERTPEFDELKECVEALGGSWEEVEKEVLKEEHAQEMDKELIDFDKRWNNRMLNEERNARRSKFKHCPILKPLVNQYLSEREQFKPKKKKNADKIIKEIYQVVDKERGESNE